jgi:hypothetical protein
MSSFVTAMVELKARVAELERIVAELKAAAEAKRPTLTLKKSA